MVFMKIILLLWFFVTLSFAAHPLAELSVTMGSFMKGNFVNEIMFLEEIRAQENQAISTFLLKPQNPNDKEQLAFIKALKTNHSFQDETLTEIVDQNRDLLCKNGFLDKLQSADIQYVYEFHFSSKEEKIRYNFGANECPKALLKEVQPQQISKKIEWNNTNEERLKTYIDNDKVTSLKTKQEMIRDYPSMSNEEKSLMLELYELNEMMNKSK
jgi:hypothetical protein